MILEEALEILTSAAHPRGWEYAAVDGSLVGRILAEDVIPGADIPPAHVCVKDGYLVRADGGWPGRARVKGECGPGEFVRALEPGSAVAAYSGCSVGDDLAALVPAEEAEASQGYVTVPRRPRALENLTPRGSSARAGVAVLPRGHRVTPMDIEAMEILGREFIRVYERPRVALLSVGSEISLEGPVRTTRYVSMDAITRALGGESVNRGVVEDSPTAIAGAIGEALRSADVVVTLGGTGPSARDVTYVAVESLGPSRIFRGLDVADAARSGGAIVDGRPLVILPGPRAPAINGAVLLLAPVILRAAGSPEEPYIAARARLTRPVHMSRRGIIWVRMSGTSAEPIQPDYYGISPSMADGYVLGGPGTMSGEVEVRITKFR